MTVSYTHLYSADIAKNLYNNPKGYFAYINQRIKFDKRIRNKYVDSARYVAMAIAHRKRYIVKNSVNPIYTTAAYPLGLSLIHISGAGSGHTKRHHDPHSPYRSERKYPGL